MTNTIKFNPEIHIATEKDGDKVLGFAPKTAEQNFEVARSMAIASAADENERLAKGKPTHRTQRQLVGKQGVALYASIQVRTPLRASAEAAADRKKKEIGANNEAIIKLAGRAEKDWFILFDDITVNISNLPDMLPVLTDDQRSQVIDSLESSKTLRRVSVKARHTETYTENNPDVLVPLARATMLNNK